MNRFLNIYQKQNINRQISLNWETQNINATHETQIEQKMCRAFFGVWNQGLGFTGVDLHFKDLERWDREDYGLVA